MRKKIKTNSQQDKHTEKQKVMDSRQKVSGYRGGKGKGVLGAEGQVRGMDRALTLGGEYAMQHMDDVL